MQNGFFILNVILVSLKIIKKRVTVKFAKKKKLNSITRYFRCSLPFIKLEPIIRYYECIDRVSVSFKRTYITMFSSDKK